MATERKLAAQQAKKNQTLEAESDKLRADLKGQSEKLADTTTRLRETENKQQTLTKQIASLRSDLDKEKKALRRERDAKALAEKALADLKTNSAKSLDDHTKLKARNEALKKELEALTKQNGNIRLASAIEDEQARGIFRPKDKLTGFIYRVDPARGWVVLNLGSQDGLLLGHHLDVVRGDDANPNVVADLQVIQVDRVRSIARFKTAPRVAIQQGDSVMSRAVPLKP